MRRIALVLVALTGAPACQAVVGSYSSQGYAQGDADVSEGGVTAEGGVDGSSGDGGVDASMGADAGAEGGTVDSGPVTHPGTSNPSCTNGGASTSSCGPKGESCCTSIEVPGGTFERTYSYDVKGGPTGLADPATVSGFQLDKYLVTVGRFRQFVTAYRFQTVAIPAGAGKHAHLNGGQGLENAASGGFESGWQSSYPVDVADSTLSSCVIQPGQMFAGSYSTWTTSAGANETLPINCITWYDAYAFCIWDGGFLPSEAELAYVQAAGAEQREYPWGSTDPGTANQYAIYGCNYPQGASGTCSGTTNLAPVGSAPLGWGSLEHLDLAGNVFAWTLDDYSAYLNPAGGCVDCANLSGGTSKAIRGGAFVYGPASLLSYARAGSSTGAPNGSFGIRCARTP